MFSVQSRRERVRSKEKVSGEGMLEMGMRWLGRREGVRAQSEGG